jgi:pyrroloquinoline quinone (PQQ) biosynthesis protein C
MSSTTDVIVDESYERQYQRELTTAGSYVPVQGIRDLGWTGWRELSGADTVREIIEWHNGFIREHSGEPYYLFLHKLIRDGELTLDELRRYYSNYYGFVNNMFPWEGIICTRMQELCQLEEKDPNGVREVRDLFRTHFYEETGHEELLADFCEKALKLDPVRDLYLPANYIKQTTKGYLKASHDYFRKIYSERHYAVVSILMFAERDLPKPHRIIRKALKSEYGVPDRNLNYFDVHSYIDIYHERYGQYILGKYASTRQIAQEAISLFQEIMKARLESEKAMYNTLRASKR